MNKLIINHGERVTEHEIGQDSLVIGRDPECDLFFADKKLSRHHARFERSGEGIRLVDLGSRNGSWINEERIDERDLVPGDEIRLGGLHIQFESVGGPRKDASEDTDQSTIYLTGSSGLPETGTVVFSGGAVPEEPEPPTEASPPLNDPSEQSASQTMVLPGLAPAPTASPGPPTASKEADDSSTVFLSAKASPLADDADETLRKSEPERTVVLPSGSSSGSPYDTGAVVYKGEVDPSILEAAASQRASASASVEVELQLDEDQELSPSASVTYVPPPSGGRTWAGRFVWLAAGLALFAILVLTVPLARILSATAAEQSALRARALLGLLAAANESALAEGRVQDLSVDRLTGEVGVTGAFLVDPQGEVLVPRARAGEKLEIEGLPVPVEEIRSFREGIGPNGDSVLAQPVSHRGRRVGVAVLSVAPAGSGLFAAALLFGVLLLAIAAAVTVLLARRMTVNALNQLRVEIDSLGDRRAGALSVERPYLELSLLAESLNRLLAARPPGGPPPGS